MVQSPTYTKFTPMLVAMPHPTDGMGRALRGVYTPCGRLPEDWKSMLARLDLLTPDRVG